MAVDVTVPVNVIVGVAVHPNTEEQNKDADLVLLSVELIAFKQFDTLGTAVQVGCAAYVNDDKTPRIVQSSNVKVIDIRPLILQLVKGNNVISYRNYYCLRRNGQLSSKEKKVHSLSKYFIKI